MWSGPGWSKTHTTHSPTFLRHTTKSSPCPAQQWPDPTVLIHFNPLLKTKPRTGAKLHCPAQVLCRFLWERCWLWLPYAGEARKWSSMPSIYILTFLSDIQVKRFRSPKLNSLWCQYLVPISQFLLNEPTTGLIQFTIGHGHLNGHVQCLKWSFKRVIIIRNTIIMRIMFYNDLIMKRKSGNPLIACFTIGIITPAIIFQCQLLLMSVMETLGLQQTRILSCWPSCSVSTNWTSTEILNEVMSGRNCMENSEMKDKIWKDFGIISYNVI